MVVVLVVGSVIRDLRKESFFMCLCVSVRFVVVAVAVFDRGGGGGGGGGWTNANKNSCKASAEEKNGAQRMKGKKSLTKQWKSMQSFYEMKELRNDDDLRS